MEMPSDEDNHLQDHGQQVHSNSCQIVLTALKMIETKDTSCPHQDLKMSEKEKAEFLQS
jgi:hypothetical protein